MKKKKNMCVCVCVSFMLLVRGKATVQIMKSFQEFEKLKSPCSLSENRAKTLTFICWMILHAPCRIPLMSEAYSLMDFGICTKV